MTADRDGHRDRDRDGHGNGHGTAGVAIRLGGALLLVGAWLSGGWLMDWMPPGAAEPVPGPALVLAMLMFMAATSGTAMLMLGGHLLDRVRVSDRWIWRGDDTPPID